MPRSIHQIDPETVDETSVGDVQNENQLIDHIGAGVMNSKSVAGTPVMIQIWDGRWVYGSYHSCAESELDVRDRADVIRDDDALRPFVQALVNEGKPFVTETGSHDMVCTLRWTIEGGEA